MWKRFWSLRAWSKRCGCRQLMAYVFDSPAVVIVTLISWASVSASFIPGCANSKFQRSGEEHGNGWQSQLHPYHQKWQEEQVTMTPVPQGSVLAPLLFNIYISDQSTIVSRKYAYADDLVIMHADGDCWQVVEGVLTEDMATDGEYLPTCKLKLSTTKHSVRSLTSWQGS